MSRDGFITATGPDGNKRRVPEHYVTNPAFGYKVPARTLRSLSPERVAELTPPADAADEKEEGKA